MSKALSALSLSVLALGLAACTSIRVTPLQSAPTTMCIEENPKVMVSDFVPVLQQGFARHGITTQLYSAIPEDRCPYVVKYTARRTWDMAPYLSSAELTILGPRRQTVASANYHLRGKGGLSLMKWQGTKSKMDPVIDELLSNTQLIDEPVAKAPAVSESGKLSKQEQLKQLQQQNLDYEAYQRAYRQLMPEDQTSSDVR
ncbi:Sbal_3080 family lipoprotein [Pseudomonas sp. URMO17WK12:I4]|uniref:Sbal_3080 family lipoprotein n=1 Tax=Pseudomonas sp. URMO17WK12:I4 TaxID=1283292 RepID=UPI0004BB3421|nr:Sbal_3080 family lipoprotein [Pseudomonas sp. URMO17WK12:I4]